MLYDQILVNRTLTYLRYDRINPQINAYLYTKYDYPTWCWE